MKSIGRKVIPFATAITLVVCGAALAACSPAESKQTAIAPEASYVADSMIGQHEARGTDITGLADVSPAACTGSGCHGGSYEAVRKQTEGYWEGIGQIGEANPHDGHGSSGYTCENCHTLSDGASVNQCNGCHDFESPEGWIDKPIDTTQYGVIDNEPLY